MPLNDTQCRNAKAKERPYKLTEGNGLYIEVKPKRNQVLALSLRVVGQGKCLHDRRLSDRPANRRARQAPMGQGTR